MNDGDNSRHCGHSVPDTNADHFTKAGFNLEVVKKYHITLSEPNIAVDDEGHRGTWTMIYDEGFEVIIGGQIFFAFNKYVPKTPESLMKDDVEDYISVCDETLVGWFHDQDKTHWGCYHAKKAGSSLIESGAHMRRRHRQNREDHVLGESGVRSWESEAAQTMWEHDLAFIETVNQANLTWRAGVHPKFIGKRMTEMWRMLGRRPSAVSRAKAPFIAAGTIRFRETDPTLPVQAELPSSFDWRKHNGRNYDSPVKNQGNCGSCFAMAAISVAEARIRIMTELRDKPLLSTQAVVSCSVYNQGCEGGYPYLVGKHAMDFGLVPRECMPYSGTDEKCKFRHGPRCPDTVPIVYATNYTYVGGYYGGCSEQHMMNEVFQKGPIMVAFDAPSSLFYYTGGIYTGDAAPHEGPHLANLNPWEKTNHAVVAVGWGEEHGHKYWIVKNTWGRQWGEKGYFRIRRGTDECGIESMAVTMDLKL